MASEVGISNRALQYLGASRIISLTEDSVNARACNACYQAARDEELAKYFWKFATTRVALAPDATAPAFDYLYQFTLPSDFLRAVKPRTVGLDWKFEGGKILTNEGNVLYLNYIRRVEDPNAFTVLFQNVVSARMAEDMAEELTQSSTRMEIATARYRKAVSEARRADAFWSAEREPVEDDWLALTR